MTGNCPSNSFGQRTSGSRNCGRASRYGAVSSSNSVTIGHGTGDPDAQSLCEAVQRDRGRPGRDHNAKKGYLYPGGSLPCARHSDPTQYANVTSLPPWRLLEKSSGQHDMTIIHVTAIISSQETLAWTPPATQKGRELISGLRAGSLGTVAMTGRAAHGVGGLLLRADSQRGHRGGQSHRWPLLLNTWTAGLGCVTLPLHSALSQF